MGFMLKLDLPVKQKGICPLTGAMIYQLGECKVLVSGERERRESGWHISISHPSRYPTWDEQKTARYMWVPDHITMVSVMPPRSEYVNIHSNCFHWHELNAEFLVAQGVV